MLSIVLGVNVTALLSCADRCLPQPLGLIENARTAIVRARLFHRQSFKHILHTMTDETKSQRADLTKSTTTIRSDSENYDESNNDISPSPPFSSRRPMILYQPPTFWSLLRGAAINLLLPFVNGLMLGFGELLAHEAAFRLGWSTDKVRKSEAALKTDTLA